VPLGDSITMSELDAQAPLAMTEEWSEFSDHHSSGSGKKDNWEGPKMPNQMLTSEKKMVNRGNQEVSDSINNAQLQQSSQNEFFLQNSSLTLDKVSCDGFNETEGQIDPNFVDAFSESLEDLVNTFDDKITNCFQDYDESLEKLAPVQVRSQEEIINNSQ